jgi:hypothetical protein
MIAIMLNITEFMIMLFIPIASHCSRNHIILEDL